MAESLLRIPPKIQPKLDPDFRPPWLGHRNFTAAVRASKKIAPLCFALERNGGAVSRFDTICFASRHPDNFFYAERVLKFLLWQRGAFRVHVHGPKEVVAHLRAAYAEGGARAFDANMLAGVYGARRFEVRHVLSKAKLPRQRDVGRPLGRHLQGCRIGFDAGGSDRKVAAVVDGQEVFATETVWEPKVRDDWRYHVEGIRDSIRQAAAHLPRVDAIGVSSAGIYVDNEVRVASLFRKVQERHPEDFEKHIRRIYLDIAREWKVPVAVANDGDVTALAGSMSLKQNAVLGIAMGTSQAAGYVDRKGHITGWLNELAFAPVDYAEGAPQDREWSGDFGTGVNYFSQEAVIRLAPRVGIELNPAEAPGARLKAVQDLFASGDPRPAAIFETIGTWLGYALLQYADFYDLRQVLILGRVTSGRGGRLILEGARRVLEAEDPGLARKIGVHLPDEASRRVGQAIAAASLPEIPSPKVRAACSARRGREPESRRPSRPAARGVGRIRGGSPRKGPKARAEGSKK